LHGGGQNILFEGRRGGSIVVGPIYRHLEKRLKCDSKMGIRKEKWTIN
jgi:hypothetical protein